MRRTLSIENGTIVERDMAGKSVQLGISAVLAKWGTEAMLALDRGESVHIITETKEDALKDRVGY